MQSKDIIDVLKNDEAKSFILRHLNDQYAELSLKYSGKTSFNIAVCLQLMGIYKKAQHKIPLVYNQLLAVDKRSYEQATSQNVAEYKQTFINGKSLLDITAGLGIDSIFLAKNFDKVIAVDHNKHLHELASYNLKELGIVNVERVLGDGVASLQGNYDWVYIDPDRRVTDKRGIKLEDLSPDVTRLQAQLEECTAKVYIKLSPMFDIHEVWRKFDAATEVHIIAQKNEVKELGVVLDYKTGSSTQMVVMHDVSSGFHFESEWKNVDYVSVEKVQQYNFLIHPNALLLKAGLAKYYLKDSQMAKHPDFELYFSDQEVIEGGRCLEVLNRGGISPKEIKKSLKNLRVTNLNIAIKGLSDKPEQWHKKLNTKDGGDYFLYLLKGKEKESYLCKRITS